MSLGSFPIGLRVLHYPRRLIFPYLWHPSPLPPLASPPTPLLPNSFSVDTPLFPPPPRHPRSRLPFRLQVQIKNRPSRYVLSNHVFSPGCVHLYLPKACLRNCLLQWGVTVSSHPLVALVASPQSSVTPSGGTPPGFSRCGGSSPTSPIQKVGLPELCSGRSVPMSTHPLPPSP